MTQRTGKVCYVLVKSEATPGAHCNLVFCHPSAPSPEYCAHTVRLEGVGVSIF